MNQLKNTATRSLETKRQIAETFLNLLETTPIEKLRVQQIADAAYVTRSSFYKYYSNKYDILDELEAEFIDSIRNVLHKNTNYLENCQTLSTDCLYTLFYPNILENMRIFQNNQTLMIAVMGPNGDVNFFDHLIHIYHAHLTKILPDSIKDKLNPIVLEMSITLITKAISTIIETWVQHKFTEPDELVTEIITIHLCTAIQLLANYPL